LEAEGRRSAGRYIVNDVPAGSGHEYPPAIDLDRSFLLQIEGERLAEIGLFLEVPHALGALPILGDLLPLHRLQVALDLEHLSLLLGKSTPQAEAARRHTLDQ